MDKEYNIRCFEVFPVDKPMLFKLMAIFIKFHDFKYFIMLDAVDTSFYTSSVPNESLHIVSPFCLLKDK